MTRPIRHKPLAPLQVDFSFSQLSDDDTLECRATYENERAAERAGDRARQAKAREFRFVGGML